MILVDDLGWGDVGYNGSKIPTPNIDKLAGEGIKFNRFYASCACTPTRASLLTGQFSYRIGQQRIVWPWNENGLSTDFKLIPQYLTNTDSYIVGKWNLGHCNEKHQPMKRGFIKHYGNFTGCIDHYKHTYPLPAGGPDLHDFTEDGLPIYPKGHTTDLLTNKTIEIIKNRSAEKDFFIYLAYNTPHVPLQAPDFYINKFNHIKDKQKRIFYAMVNHLDDSIGKIIDELKKQNILEDTLIWFSSDNGGWVGLGGDNGKLKGGKTNFYEGGIRVVNFLNYPKLESKVDNNPRHITDILPTLLHLKGQEYKNLDIDGKDIFSICPDREIVHSFLPTGCVGGPNNEGDAYGCISVGNYKLIKKSEIEIYDVELDPYEKNNLSKDKNLADSLLRTFFSKKDNYKFVDLFEYHNPTGYPPNYKFPNWWGELRNSKLKIMSQNLYFEENKSFTELLGYDIFEKN